MATVGLKLGRMPSGKSQIYNSIDRWSERSRVHHVFKHLKREFEKLITNRYQALLKGRHDFALNYGEDTLIPAT